MPTTVTNMDINGVDGSLSAADRFWHIDAAAYATKPDLVLEINYNDGSSEIGTPNSITESNLEAQRFNTTLNHWEGVLLGTNDVPNTKVANIVVPSASFFENWTLVDQSNPLPITLTNFEVSCNNENIHILWTTQTEINNDYFVVEKSSLTILKLILFK